MPSSALPTYPPADALPDRPPENLVQLVYVSSATTPFSPEELTTLLPRWREANTRRQITGLLLYKDGNVMQVLEGGETEVRATFERIAANPRHRGVITLLNAPLPARNFSDWSMGFRNLNDPAIRNLPGFREFADQSLAELRSPAPSLKLLNIFRARM